MSRSLSVGSVGGQPSGSLTVKSTLCQPVAPSGSTSCSTPVCTWPVLAGRAHPHRVVARLERQRRRPLHPRVDVRHRRQRAGLPGPAVDGDLDALDAGVLLPRDARRRRPDASPGTSDPDRGTSIREADLDRSLLGPALARPVGLDLVEAGHLEVDDPLARRDVAVEAGHHRPHREAVLDRQRLAVHRHRQDRVAAVDQRGQRGAAGPAVVGGLQHGVGALLDPGLRRAGRTRGRRSTRRCRSGRRRPGWTRS